MSTFYSTIKGSRGAATRCGSKASGVTASAQSYEGSVTVSLRKKGDDTIASIMVGTGSTTGGKILWSGPIAELLAVDSIAVNRLHLTAL